MSRMTWVSWMFTVSTLAACSENPMDRATETPPVLRMVPATPTTIAGMVGRLVEPAPTVLVTDQDGRPVAGVTVAFSLGGPGTYPNGSVQTGSGGLATAAAWSLGTTVQSYTLYASSTGLPDVVFTAVAGPGPAVQLEPVSGQLQRGNTGQSLPEHVRVRVLDVYSNPVPGVTVSFAVVAGTGSVQHQEAVSNLVGVASGGSWTLGGEGGTQRVIARANGYSASFEAVGCDPDCQSQQLVFVTPQGFQRVNVGGVVTSFVGAGQVSQPAWSPNGARMAFVKFENAKKNTYVMNADGTGTRLLAVDAHSPSWSPDNRTLVVAVGSCVYDCGLALIDADDPHQPAQAISSMAGSLPAWSPDGQKIAYVSLSGDDGFHQLRTMNADGTGDAAVSVRDHGSMPGISWSPDGTSLAFSWCHGSECDLYIASEGTIRQLTTSGMARGASWSPDGSKIAFVVQDYYYAYYTYVAYIDLVLGGDFVFLSPGSDPAWVPRPSVTAPGRRRMR